MSKQFFASHGYMFATETAEPAGQAAFGVKSIGPLGALGLKQQSRSQNLSQIMYAALLTAGRPMAQQGSQQYLLFAQGAAKNCGA
jgi:hypothetical protein